MGADRGAEAFQSQFAELFEDETFAYAEVGNRVRYQDLFRLRMGAERRRMMWAQCRKNRRAACNRPATDCYSVERRRRQKHEMADPSPPSLSLLVIRALYGNLQPSSDRGSNCANAQRCD